MCAPFEARSNAVLCPPDGICDKLASFSTVTPADCSHPFSRFKIFVVFKKNAEICCNVIAGMSDMFFTCA